MIAVATCKCGRCHEAGSFARLAIVQGDPMLQTRRCSCGRELTVATIEADAATGIATFYAEASELFRRARLELAAQRLDKVVGAPVKLDTFQRLRAEAKRAIATAHHAERLLAGIYRARELRAPARRLGRNLVLVEVVDPCADTERPPAVTR